MTHTCFDLFDIFTNCVLVKRSAGFQRGKFRRSCSCSVPRNSLTILTITYRVHQLYMESFQLIPPEAKK